MTESASSGYADSPATSDPGGDRVDGAPEPDRGDAGGQHIEPSAAPLTTDDEALRDDDPARPGNAGA